MLLFNLNIENLRKFKNSAFRYNEMKIYERKVIFSTSSAENITFLWRKTHTEMSDFWKKLMKNI